MSFYFALLSINHSNIIYCFNVMGALTENVFSHPQSLYKLTLDKRLRTIYTFGLLYRVLVAQQQKSVYWIDNDHTYNTNTFSYLNYYFFEKNVFFFCFFLKILKNLKKKRQKLPLAYLLTSCNFCFLKILAVQEKFAVKL